MNNIKVSVLTPIYNHDIVFVRECLESLHAQTLKECEFILIDNGSGQESKELIKEFLQRDSRFICINIAKNEGYGKAMNIGLAASRGEYIGIVESDDFVSPEMYEKLYEKGHDNDVDIVKSRFTHYQSNSPEKIGIAFKKNEYYKILKNLDVPDFCFKYGSYWSAIYKKSMIINNDIQ